MWLHVLKYIRQSIQSFHSLSLFVIVFQKSLMSFFLIEFKSIENLPPSKGWDLERLRSAELHQAVGISACPSVWIRGQDAASSCVESKLKLWCLLYFSNWRLLSLEFVPANAKWQKLRTKMIFLRDLPNAAPPGGLTNWLDKALSVLAQKKPLRLDSGLFVTLLRRILHLSQLAQRKYYSFPAVCHEWHEWVELPVKKSRTITSPLHVSSQAPSSLSSKDGCAKGVSFGDRLKPVWCIKITSCQPTVCVCVTSFNRLFDSTGEDLIDQELWFFWGYCCAAFLCYGHQFVCVHLLSHRARSTLSNDAWTTALSVEAKICLEWMDWLVCHWLLFLAMENENGNQRMCVS